VIPVSAKSGKKSRGQLHNSQYVHFLGQVEGRKDPALLCPVLEVDKYATLAYCVR
jgi:hypothetical protein